MALERLFMQSCVRSCDFGYADESDPWGAGRRGEKTLGNRRSSLETVEFAIRRFQAVTCGGVSWPRVRGHDTRLTLPAIERKSKKSANEPTGWRAQVHGRPWVEVGRGFGPCANEPAVGG